MNRHARQLLILGAGLVLYIGATVGLLRHVTSMVLPEPDVKWAPREVTVETIRNTPFELRWNAATGQIYPTEEWK